MQEDDISISIYCDYRYYGQLESNSSNQTVIRFNDKEYQSISNFCNEENINYSQIKFVCFNSTIVYTSLMDIMKEKSISDVWLTEESELYYLRAIIKGIIIRQNVLKNHQIIEFCRSFNIKTPFIVDDRIIFDMKEDEEHIKILVGKRYFNICLSLLNPINIYNQAMLLIYPRDAYYIKKSDEVLLEWINFR